MRMQATTLPPAMPAAAPGARPLRPWQAWKAPIVAAAAVLGGSAAFALLTRCRFLYSTYFKDFDEFQHIASLWEVATRGYPAISMTPSVLAASPWWYHVPAKDIPLDAILLKAPYFNDWLFHASFIQYLQAPAVWLMGAAWTCAASTIGIVFAIALIPVWYLRRRQVPWAAAALFSGLVLCHQHTLGILLGEYNPMRLAIPFSLAAFICADKDLDSPGWALLWGMLAALCREEAGFYCGLGIGAYIVVTRRLGWKWAAVAATLGLYSIGLILVSRMDASIPLATKGALSSIVSLRADLENLLRPNRLSFLAVNFAGLGLLAFFDWRKAGVALLLMGPNMVTTIGGAEATGFATYYHSFYVGGLLWASMSGLAALWARPWPPRVRSAVAAALLVLPAAYACLSNADIRHPSWWMRPVDAVRYYRDSYKSRHSIGAYAAAMRRAVRPEDKVVLGPPVIPLAGYVRHAFFAPVNLTEADVVILYDTPDGPSIQAGAWLEPQAVNKRVLEIMASRGFDVAAPEHIDRFLVYRKGGVR